MKKRILAAVLILAMILSCVPIVPANAVENTQTRAIGTTYYVSSEHGAANNSGTSEDQAFSSLLKINEIELQPGDRVLLERGSVFQNEYLHIKGSGSEDAPIIIDVYGDENKPKPLINTNGYGVWHQDYNIPSLDSQTHVLKGDVSSCILLKDVEYIEISNIAMTNEGNFGNEVYNTADRMDRTGVAGLVQNIGTADHIYLKNLDIYNIQGNVYNKHMCNGGIYMVCALPENEATGISRYNDVLIEGCTLNNVNRWGIAVGYTCYWSKFSGAAISDENCMTYGSTNVVVRNNYLNEIGGDPITMMYCYQPLVEYNVAVAFARDMNSSVYAHPVSQKNGGKNRGGMLAAGIWPWKCKTPVFQYNECYDAYYSQDSQAWDADSGDGCIYQYNYSANNAGGTVMFCLQEAVNTIFRYNISKYDLDGILNLSSNPNGEIYNNVFYMKEGVKVNRMRNGTTNIYNNIFYYDSATPANSTVCNWSWIKGTWSNNIYYNFSSIPNDPNAITADPLFVDAASAPVSAQANGKVYDRSAFNGFKLQENSPAIDAGKPVSSAGGQDFFGNKLDIMPDIGAYETGTYVADGNAEIISTPYMITGSGAKQILNVPSQEKNPTTTVDVLNNIEIAEKSTAAILKDGKEAGREVISDGLILRIYAESGVYRDYTIKVKNTYNFVEDYSATQQGNVWFYQYGNADGTYANMEAHDEWGGWMESYDASMGDSRTWATVAKENNSLDGILAGPVWKCDVVSAAMAWRAPKAGSVALNFAGGTNADGGVKARGTQTGGTVYLKITRNGEDLITPVDIGATGGVLYRVDPVTVQVEAGDYIRVEAYSEITGDTVTSPSFFVTPELTYLNTGDTEAPSAPTALSAIGIQANKAIIGWTASTDNVAVEGYNVYLDGTKIGSTANTSYSIHGLTPDTEYTVTVEAFDLANNVSQKGSVTFTAKNSEDLIYTLPESVSLSGEGKPLGQDVVNASKNLNALTVSAQFVQSGSGIGDIISFSQSSASANHLHIYVNGARLGLELRGANFNYHVYADCLNAYEGNSVAVVFDPADYTIKLFANGELATTKQLTQSSWYMLKDITGMDTATVGYCFRNHTSKYAFSGDITDLNVYSTAHSDEEMIAYTSVDVATPEKETHIFSATGSMFYRIPSLLSLSNGSLIAAADARFGSAGDSPNNLDTAVAIRPAGSDQWEKATLPFHFQDISDKAGAVANNSASFIDPVMVEAADGTVYLFVDAFPYGTGSARSQAGSGMITVNGKKYVALTEKGKSVTDMANFTLYIGENGTVYDSTTGEATAYSVDENFNLYKNGDALTIQQRDPNLQYNGTRVAMNIFYEESELQVYRTSYLWMASSSNGGRTWSAPQILNDLKLENEGFLGFGPGVGYVISKGEYAGRILIPVYSNVSGRGERSSVIYSDDNGKTWNRGATTELTSDTALNPGKTSEAQFVELPDGTIRMYARGVTGYVGYADSADGVNYGLFKEDPQLAYCGNSMVSVINYSKEIDGYPALILSCPEHRENRGDGIIRVGLIKENTDPDAAEKYTVDWKYRYEVNRDEFIYSSLAELASGKIGMLYETHVDSGAPLNYVEYDMSDLLVEEDSAINFMMVDEDAPQPGDEITVTVNLKKPVTNVSELSTATLEILYPESGFGKDALTFLSISDDNMTLTYQGILPDSDEPYDYIIRMPEWCSHPTVGKKSPVVTTEDGLVNPANKDTLYGTAGLMAEPGDPTVTDFTASPVELPAAGGEVTVTILGSHLKDGIDVKSGELTAKTEGTSKRQTATLSIPENERTEEVTYTIQYSLDGTTYEGEATVTVAAAAEAIVISVGVGETVTREYSVNYSNDVDTSKLDRNIADVTIVGTDGTNGDLSAPVTAIESGKKYLIVNDRAGKPVVNDPSATWESFKGLALRGSITDYTDAAVWTIEAVNGGYTLKNGNSYMSMNAGVYSATVTNEPVVVNVSINQTTGKWNVYMGEYYLNNAGGKGECAFFWDGETLYDAPTDQGSQWTIYEVGQATDASTTVTITGVSAGETTFRVGPDRFKVVVDGCIFDQKNTDEAYLATPADCENAATYYYSCVCGEKGTETFVYGEPLGHIEEIILAVEATCTETGLTEGKKCSVCGEILVAQEEIPALGHEWKGTGCENCDATRENPFVDVPEDSFYIDPVLWAVDKGITTGTTPTTFDPNGQCMRAVVVTFLWRAAGSPEPTSAENPFVDVKETDFFYKAVLWAVEKGITNGMDATHFAPTALCNRAQVVTFLYRAMGNPEVTSTEHPFTDVAEDQFYFNAMLWAVENGITNGLTATTFGPTATCNRAQVVTFLYRAYEK
ncbi:MAG: S-layer homology domain-containing protein [Oscillospiraceae bacterium]|nr:S-layer homology domain-containing protein [Oscillospiraceae bacterium]